MVDGIHLWILTGCTAVGKTALSLQLAQFLETDILSCDSVQVYRGADIGSAKVTPKECAQVRHYGIDLCDPDETFNVENYRIYAEKVIQKVLHEGKRSLLVVGGTGFYLKSFFKQVTDSISVPQSVKSEVDVLFQEQGLEGLQLAIKEYGPIDLNESDWKNPRRLLAILGKQRVTGLSQVALKQQFLAQREPFPKLKKTVILLEREDKSLKKLVKQRIDQMFEAGFLEEVFSLQQTYGERLSPVLQSAIGYREILQFLSQKNTLNATEKDDRSTDLGKLKADIEQATYHLIKKQKTWFRTQIPVTFRINLDRQLPYESFDLLRRFCREFEV